ncbi:glycosyltransferase involved in cell wall biosynthesis [Aminobacter niigataensis]|uniref:Glycosyltransferase involved in cell wall biosynthesis n=1 Tax=Aminobacter niigataensis TaxID=83265 RepID=A0ABR6L2G0_9HYPH|nr:glycosyltransferase involved in cell wall biosynthesis [Aminobacter niigataensis]
MVTSSRISYWLKDNGTQNFGDYLTEFLLEEVFYPLGMSAKSIHLIGSVIDDMFVDMDSPSGEESEAKTIFWGCGVRQPGGLSAKGRERALILSVRGPLSATELRLEDSVPLGDPAFVLPALYSPGRVSDFKGRSVCIPHFHDQRTDQELKKISGCDLVIRPNIKPSIEEIHRFIDELTSSNFVLSAAMHPALVAAAYNRPFAFWDNGSIDLPFKWNDVAATMGIEAKFASDLKGAKKIYRHSIAPYLKIPELLPSLMRAPMLLRPYALMKVASYESKLPGFYSSFEKFDLPYLDMKKDLKYISASNEEMHYEVNQCKKSLATVLAARQEVDVVLDDVQKKLLQSRIDEEKLRQEVRAFQALTPILGNPSEIHMERLPSDGRRIKIGPLKIRRPSARRLKQKLMRIMSRARTKIDPVAQQALLRFDDARPTVLMVDGVYPRPDRDSGSVDAVNFIQIFQELGFRVIFFADTEYTEESPYRENLEEMGVNCICAPAYWSVEEFLRAHGGRIDVAFLSRVYCGGRIIEEVRRNCGDAKIVFNTVDLHHIREEREARMRGDRKAINRAQGTRERELAVARLADVTIVVSHEERRLLNQVIPGTPVSVVPLIRGVPGRKSGYLERSGIGFIGGYLHRPNTDAVTFFLDQVWPEVRKRLPEVKFYAMGADMPEHIRTRKDAGYVAVGHVSDLAESLEQIRVMVAPLRYGAGAKGKVVTSLAHGVPCVVTKVAAEGMALVHGQSVLIADSPGELAEQLVRLYTDEGLWNELSDGGYSLISEEHSFSKGRENIREILLEIGSAFPGGGVSGVDIDLSHPGTRR